jgi:hypothetical protein
MQAEELLDRSMAIVSDWCGICLSQPAELGFFLSFFGPSAAWGGFFADCRINQSAN